MPLKTLYLSQHVLGAFENTLCHIHLDVGVQVNPRIPLLRHGLFMLSFSFRLLCRLLGLHLLLVHPGMRCPRSAHE